uniref:Uncharacterized protein n=1 Tax=Meloidogyne enterolobii TaxID=390850 RepID=A0A6V7WEY6_MELEN|nr:unnamed protein product [Meloidogyne enterolobii]
MADKFYPPFPKKHVIGQYTFVEPDFKVKFPIFHCCQSHNAENLHQNQNNNSHQNLNNNKTIINNTKIPTQPQTVHEQKSTTTLQPSELSILYLHLVLRQLQ